MTFAALRGHPRLTPVRSDLAAFSLKDQISAPRYSKGVTLHVGRPLAGMSDGPDTELEMINQLVFGEPFTVYDVADGWAWGQSEDGYVGYIPAKHLRERAPAPTHRVVAVQCHVRPAPDFKKRPVGSLPYNARIQVIGGSGPYRQIEGGGYVATAQIAPLSEPAADWVAEAETFLRAPYMWGGRTHAGVDCSGLIQASMQAAGMDCPRDSDMQEKVLGRALGDAEAPARGDLVFWKGHVGVMTDGDTLFHANAHHMAGAYEGLEAAKARILAAGGGEPTSVRRIG